MRVYVVIPTHNEAKTIGWLVKKIKDFSTYEVIVVDDGSSDKTCEIAQQNGAVVLCNKRNLGKGTSLKIGFDWAVANHCDWVLTMDGDGQHNPEEIPYLIEFAQNAKMDIVVGNRMHQPRNMPLIRFLTNRVMSAIISRLVHQHIPDTQCGMRLIRRSVLEKLNLRSANFEIESEMLIQAKRLGFPVASFPIKTIYSPDIISQINPIIDTLRFLKFILTQILG